MAKLKSFKSGNFHLIHGNSGSGKTTLLGSYPKPMLILDTDGGLETLLKFKHINVDKIDYVVIENRDQILDMMVSGSIAGYDLEDFKTIALDHITNLRDIIVDYHKNGPGGTKGVMNQDKWGKVNADLGMLISYFKALSNEGHIPVIISQTDTIGVDEDSNTWSDEIPIERVPALTPRSRVKLMAGCNVAIYCSKSRSKVNGKKQLVHVADIGGTAGVYTKNQSRVTSNARIVNPTYKKIKDKLKGE